MNLMSKEQKSFNLDVTVEYDYYKGYDAPYTYNHDDPRYSDPGSPPVVENMRVFFRDEDVTEMIEQFMPHVLVELIDIAYEKGRE